MDVVIEFIKWCFKDAQSGLATIIVLAILYNGTIGIINAINGSAPDAPDDD